MEIDSTRNVSRTDLPSELGFALAARKTDPTPVVTRSGEVIQSRRTDLLHGHQVTRTGRSRNECRSGSRIPTRNRNPTWSR